MSRPMMNQAHQWTTTPCEIHHSSRVGMDACPLVTVLPREIYLVIRDMLTFIDLVALACTCTYYQVETRMTRALRMTDSPPQRMPRSGYMLINVLDAFKRGIKHRGWLNETFERQGKWEKQAVIDGLSSAVMHCNHRCVKWIMATYPRWMWYGQEGWSYVIEKAIETGDETRLKWILDTFEPDISRGTCFPKHRVSRTVPGKAGCYDLVMRYLGH
jgi:hypothetical protein